LLYQFTIRSVIIVFQMWTPSLNDYDIYIKREGTGSSIADCPSQLRDLFVLILSVRSLEWDYFGGTTAQERSLQPTPVMQYQSELKLEAEELAGVCGGPRRLDDSEERWVQVMQPIVMYRFDAEFEEVYARRRHHHWSVASNDLNDVLLTSGLALSVAGTFHFEVGHYWL
jgi:hypothetical protein